MQSTTWGREELPGRGTWRTGLVVTDQCWATATTISTTGRGATKKKFRGRCRRPPGSQLKLNQKLSSSLCSSIYLQAFCVSKTPRRGQWTVNQSKGFRRGPKPQEHRLCPATTSHCFRSVSSLCPRLLHSDHPRKKGKVFSAFLLTLLFDRPDASDPNFLACGWLMYMETGMYFMTFLHCYYLLIYWLHKTDNSFFVCSAHPGSPTFPSGKRISPSHSTCSNDWAALGVTELNHPLVVA